MNALDFEGSSCNLGGLHAIRNLMNSDVVVCFDHGPWVLEGGDSLKAVLVRIGFGIGEHLLVA